MATTEAQKRARAKYQAAHNKSVAVKLTIEQADAFTAALERAGETKYKVLKEFILDYTANH